MACLRTEPNRRGWVRAEIQSHSCASCGVCGKAGKLLYEGLKDRLFEAGGTWCLKRCTNDACGLIWLDPKPLDEEIYKAYAGYYTHNQEQEIASTLLRRIYRVVKKNYLSSKYSYDLGFGAPFNSILGSLMYLHPGRRADLDASVFYLNFKRGGQLLDIGCGSGIMLKGLHELGWQVQGVDFDPDAVRIALAKGLQVHVGSVADHEFPDDFFDAVTMSHLIEHIADPVALLIECHRILKPSGQLVIITPNANSWCHSLFGANWRGLEPPRHIHIFKVAPLKNALQKAGFQQIYVSTTIRGADFYFVASRALQQIGRHQMGAVQPWNIRLWGKVMQNFEWFRLKLDREAGEEIAAIAQK
jgi:2-polyprenyl-3-methyl-5-hydroxy-6-metoxy-1,4-benzoquinol methylase